MFKKKKNLVVETEIAEITEQLKTEMPENELELKEFLVKINSLLKFITEIDYVKEMLNGINRQAELIENVAASSEELTASIEDISEFVQESSQKTTHSIETSSAVIIEIDDSFKSVVKSFESAKQVTETMDKVSEEAQKIDQMITIIKSVADQTNLLALNASIEAARAGEHGRGFSVVADEIKKLAENTKQQVAFISETVSALTSEIKKTSDALEVSNSSFEEGKIRMEAAVSHLDGMGSDLESINSTFIEISASVEEQTAASQEMSSAVMIINDEMKNLHKQTEKTGRAFNSTSEMLNDIRLEVIGNIGKLDIETEIEICICDHLMWKWRIYNIILGFETLADIEVCTHKTCRLGKWVAATTFEHEECQKIIDHMELPHTQVHALAKKAVEAHNRGQNEAAENFLEEINKATVLVMKDLKAIKKFIRKSKKQTEA